MRASRPSAALASLPMGGGLDAGDRTAAWNLAARRTRRPHRLDAPDAAGPRGVLAIRPGIIAAVHAYRRRRPRAADCPRVPPTDLAHRWDASRRVPDAEPLGPARERGQGQGPHAFTGKARWRRRSGAGRTRLRARAGGAGVRSGGTTPRGHRHPRRGGVRSARGRPLALAAHVAPSVPTGIMPYFIWSALPRGLHGIAPPPRLSSRSPSPCSPLPATAPRGPHPTSRSPAPAFPRIRASTTS